MARILSALVVGMLVASSAQAQVVVYPTRIGTMSRMYSTPTVVVAPRIAAPAPTVVVAPRYVTSRVAYAPRQVYRPAVRTYGMYRPTAAVYGARVYGGRSFAARGFGGTYVAPRAYGRYGVQATTVRAGRVGVGATSYRSVGRVGMGATTVRTGGVRFRR